jgi:hypothetical protein
VPAEVGGDAVVWGDGLVVIVIMLADDGNPATFRRGQV